MERDERQQPAVKSILLTKEELMEALGFPSTRMVDELMRKRKIPYLRLGHKTVRFDLPKVLSAIQKLEVKEAGR
ncbi:hypothetical protein [Verrucomicrobium spinosum]|uniref:hypothetical protein n=1 Tax=Verrucomicrobium spinosum TaxID=2736 RepID=UPI0001746AA8|nr:hypothetical protein [Verrucomicrobium spinosum]